MPVQAKEFIYAHGSRKRASARVRLYPKGSGKIFVNEKELERPDEIIVSPLTLAGLKDKVDVTIRVVGGGFSSQKEAIRHGLARALVNMDEGLRSTMRKAGFLTRDPREKERKKPGLKRARRAPQWQKR